MNSQVSHYLVNSLFGIKGKNGFQLLTTLHELVIKTAQKREKKKRKKIDLILISLLRWTWT